MAFSRRWLLILFALILSGGQLSAASAKEQSAYAAAVAAFKDEMWNRAETEFDQFVQKYPKSTNAPQAVLMRAQAEFKQGSLADAIALLADTNHLTKAGTLADQYIYWIAEAQFQNRDFASAARTFVSLAKNYPESPLRLRAVVEAASAYAQSGGWPQAGALLEETNGVFQRAAQMDAANELVLRGRLLLAQAKFAQNDFAAAAAVLESLDMQTLQPRLDWQRIYLLCQVKLAAGDTNAALAATTNLLQAAVDGDGALQAESVAMHAGVLEQLGFVAEAMGAYQGNLTNSAPAERQRQAVLKIAELAIAQGQSSNAEASLGTFIAQFADSPAAEIALLTLGELHLKDYAAEPSATNHLLEAQARFDQLLSTYTNSPHAGKAYLDRGWCGWLEGNMSNSLADFKAAAQSADLPPEDLAVARYKMGDALFALKDYEGALENYRAVLDDFTNFPAVAGALGDRALYQSLRANLELTNMDGASSALSQILEKFPASELAPNSTLLYGEGLAEARRPADSREQFQKFLALFPDTRLRPQVEFAIARTYDMQQDWSNAIAGYQGWLDRFPTNQFQQQAIYALARANALAGNETNAFGMFTNFVAQFPTNELAPQAQWWVADHFFNGADYVDAEKNYELVYQNQNFPANDLAYPARLMAGRAADARQGYSDAIGYFSKLEGDTNCPEDLRQQAIFAHGSALMHAESTVTNNPLANFQLATNVFSRICRLYPTNEICAQAWIEIGNCNLQLTNYAAATNDYGQVAGFTNTSMSTRCQAQIGLGIVLEKMAALATGVDQTNLLQMALDNYLKVFFSWTGNSETADQFWVGKAGLQALPLLQTLGAGDPDKFINQMEELFPQSKDSLEKKRAALLQPKN